MTRFAKELLVARERWKIVTNLLEAFFLSTLRVYFLSRFRTWILTSGWNHCSVRELPNCTRAIWMFLIVFFLHRGPFREVESTFVRAKSPVNFDKTGTRWYYNGRDRKWQPTMTGSPENDYERPHCFTLSRVFSFVIYFSFFFTMSRKFLPLGCAWKAINEGSYEKLYRIGNFNST